MLGSSTGQETRRFWSLLVAFGRVRGYSLHMPWHAWSWFFSPFRGIAWPRDGILSRLFAGTLFLPVAFAAAQSGSSRDNAEILGAWEGESKCTLPDSPCHDEHVIYEISADRFERSENGRL